LLDPIYDNVPLRSRADLAQMRAEITAELGPPASWDEADRAVKRLAGIPMHTEETLPDPVALGNEMIRKIVDRNIPLAILWQAVDQAFTTREWCPSVAWTIKTCDALQRRPNEWLRAIDNREREHDRRDREVQARRDSEAENAAWLRDLQSRLARRRSTQPGRCRARHETPADPAPRQRFSELASIRRRRPARRRRGVSTAGANRACR
jgi:hypothetical protein